MAQTGTASNDEQRLATARVRVLELFRDRPISLKNLQRVADNLKTDDLEQLRDRVETAPLDRLNRILVIFGEQPA